MTDFETRPRGPLTLDLEPWCAALRDDVLAILLARGPLSMFALAEALEVDGAPGTRAAPQWTAEARHYRTHPVNVQLGRLCLSLYHEGALDRDAGKRGGGR